MAGIPGPLSGKAPVGDSMYVCGAGMNTFHVDPEGCLYPCLMVRAHKYSLLGGSFRTGWTGKFPVSRIKWWPKIFPAATVNENSYAAIARDFLTWKAAEARCHPHTCAPWARSATNI